MDSLISGTMAGAGSFRCKRCGYVLTLAAADVLLRCPECAGDDFARASLFSAGHQTREGHGPSPEADDGWVERARSQIEHQGDYLAYVDSGELKLHQLRLQWTRIGRSLAADIRFDDPTVSRRHALVVLQDDGVRVLDDRSLNGVFVNGERVEWRILRDGDEVVVGRYHMRFLTCSESQAPAEDRFQTA